MITPDEICRRIQDALPDAKVRLEDLTGGGDHWQAVVVSSAFAGKTRLEQHQMVYAPLREALVSDIHALTLRTFTPEAAREAGLLQE